MSRELDVACARAMGLTFYDAEWLVTHKIYDAPADAHWTDSAIARLGGGAPIPSYAADHAAARLLEDEIERRGLWREYISSLKSEAYGDDPVYEEWGILMWSIIRATPEERARAFLATLHDAATA